MMELHSYKPTWAENVLSQNTCSTLTSESSSDHFPPGLYSLAHRCSWRSALHVSNSRKREKFKVWSMVSTEYVSVLHYYKVKKKFRDWNTVSWGPSILDLSSFGADFKLSSFLVDHWVPAKQKESILSSSTLFSTMLPIQVSYDLVPAHPGILSWVWKSDFELPWC